MPAFNMTWFVVGCVGGLLPDVLRLIRSRHEGQLPPYLGTINFWVGLLLLVLMGGAAAWLGSANSLIDALALGFAAPEFISRILGESSDSSVQAFANEDSNAITIRDWWSI